MQRCFAMILLNVSLIPAVALGQALSAEQPTWTDRDTWTLRFLPLGKDFTYTIACTPDCGAGLASGWVGVPDIINFIPTLYRAGKEKAYFAVIPWPLVQGETWTWTGIVDVRNPTDKWQTTFTATAFEPVNVLAETFDAVRIAAKQCNETQQNVCRDFTVWYAPKAKYFVKIAYSESDAWPSPPRGGRWELLSYQLH